MQMIIPACIPVADLKHYFGTLALVAALCAMLKYVCNKMYLSRKTLAIKRVFYYKQMTTKHPRLINMTSQQTPVDFAAPQHTTSTLLIIDVVESVRLMEANEEDAVRRWRNLVQLVVRDVLPQYSGRLLKSLGDGLMLEFAAPRPAVHAALHIQQLCHAAHHGVPPQQRVQLRAGIHTCNYVTDAHDIYGADVNLAVRLTTLAGPGEIIVSAPVRDQLTPALDGDIEDLGDCYMKHLVSPVRAYRVGSAGATPIIEPGSSRPLDLRPTIAVIPFAARGTEPGHALIGEAVADELIAALSKTAELHVISRLSTTAFADRPGRANSEGGSIVGAGNASALADIRQHLGATYVLSGRCTVIGSNMNLFVELAEADGGRIVWADNLKGTVAGLFNPDDDMLSRIVAAVSSAVMKHELGRAQNHALPTLEGYTLLLGAVAMMHHNSPTDFDMARQMLEHLITRSKRHPVPHAWLANWHVLRVQQGWAQDIELEAKLALDCTKQALDCEPNNSLALAVDGFVHTNLLRDTDTGAKRYLAALEANPNDTLALLLKGTMHAFRGEGDEAVKNTKQAIRLTPLDPLKYFYDSLAATAALSANKYEDAILLANRSLRANRTHTSTIRALAIAQVGLGQLQEAKSTVSRLLELEPSFTAAKFLARSPSSNFSTGAVWSQALISAGLPT
jgi:adenylate cyclase